MIIYKLRLLVILISAIVLIIGYKNKRKDLLWLYMVGSLCADVLTFIIRRIFHSDAYSQVVHLFTIFEICIFVFYFNQNRIINRKTVSILCIIILSIFTFGFFHNYNLLKFKVDGKLHALSLIIPLILSIFAYFKMLKIDSANIVNITNTPFFWGNTAIFIYTSCGFLLRLTNYLLKQYPIKTQEVIFLLFLLFVIIKTILMGIALSKKTNRC